MIDIKVYNDFNEISRFREEWDEFIECNFSDIFQTFDWCRIWWKYYGQNRKLCVFVLRKDGHIIGILPLFIGDVFLFPFRMSILKYIGSDYTLCQFTPAILIQHLHEITEALINKLSEYQFDLFHFGPFAGRFDAIGQLKMMLQGCQSDHYTINIISDGIQTYFKLAESWERYLASLPKKQRYNIKRQYKQIEEGNQSEHQLIYSKIVDRENFEKSFDDFVRLHSNYWNSRKKPGHFADWPHSAEFHKEAAGEQLKCGRLRLIKVSLGFFTLGYEYAYVCGDLCYGLLGARIEEQSKGLSGVGRIIFVEHIKQAISDGATYIDSMRGEYTHKTEWGGELTQMSSIHLIRNHWASRLKVKYLIIFRRFLHLVYYRFFYGILFPKLKIAKGGLLDIWIRTRL